MSRFQSSRFFHRNRQLPRPGDPLVLSDGTVLTEEKPKPEFNPDSKIDIVVRPRDFRAHARRNLKDFPANESMFRAISVVFTMTVYGISNVEICDALNISLDQLDELRAHQGYADLFNSILNEFINSNSDMLQSRIAAYSHAAVSRIGHLVDYGKKEEIRFAASKDMLDRAGLRPQDLMASQQASQNELQIRITKKTDDVIVDVKLGSNPSSGENDGTD